MTALKYWWRYLWSRFQNEWRQAATLPLREKDVVGEVMGKLKLDPTLRTIIEEKEAEMDAERNAVGKSEQS
ncbi:MAG TPA: hypothetical protein VLQ80_01635 [Candidatus Saccharimonadia bacterium]|nr:hypothetical protein [Candidatus Saccharimonadia bacterium]